MKEVEKALNVLGRFIPKSDGKLLTNKLRHSWLGNLGWIAFYRIGVWPTNLSCNEHEESRLYGHFYSQLLNLTIGIAEVNLTNSEMAFNPIELWIDTIKGQIQYDFEFLALGDRKGELSKIKAHNARLLKDLKNGNFVAKDDEPISRIYSLSTMIATGKVGDSESVKKLRKRFRNNYWQPYLTSFAELNDFINQRAYLQVEEGETVYKILGGRRKVRIFPGGRSGFKSGRGPKSK